MRQNSGWISRSRWQRVIGFVAAIVVMSSVVVSRAQLQHVPPAYPTYIVLHSFGGADGGGPWGGLTQDAAGNLYGTTTYGGATSTCIEPYGCGVVFKLTPPYSGLPVDEDSR